MYLTAFLRRIGTILELNAFQKLYYLEYVVCTTFCEEPFPIFYKIYLLKNHVCFFISIFSFNFHAVFALPTNSILIKKKTPSRSVFSFGNFDFINFSLKFVALISTILQLYQ